MTDRYPFLSATEPACPAGLLEQARRLRVPRVALVNAGAPNPLAGIRDAAEQGLADPILVGDEAKGALPDAEVAGPMAMDLILSKEAAAAKHYDSPVAGDADVLLTPNITTGNALFKLMVLGMGCCAGGLVLGARVPILLTSRAQGSAARTASAALGVIAAGPDGL